MSMHTVYSFVSKKLVFYLLLGDSGWCSSQYILWVLLKLNKYVN